MLSYRPIFNDHVRFPPWSQIIASAHYMLSELFQLDEPPEADSDGSLRAGSEDSYSDEEGEEEEEEELAEDDSDGSSSDAAGDSKAIAVIRSVGELSVPEKYKSTHQIRVSLGSAGGSPKTGAHLSPLGGTQPKDPPGAVTQGPLGMRSQHHLSMCPLGNPKDLYVALLYLHSNDNLK